MTATLKTLSLFDDNRQTFQCQLKLNGRFLGLPSPCMGEKPNEGDSVVIEHHGQHRFDVPDGTVVEVAGVFEGEEMWPAAD